MTFKLKMQMCCRRCGALMRVIALIEKPDIIEPILKYLDRWRISYRPVYRANVMGDLRPFTTLPLRRLLTDAKRHFGKNFSTTEV